MDGEKQRTIEHTIHYDWCSYRCPARDVRHSLEVVTGKVCKSDCQYLFFGYALYMIRSKQEMIQTLSLSALCLQTLDTNEQLLQRLLGRHEVPINGDEVFHRI